MLLQPLPRDIASKYARPMTLLYPRVTDVSDAARWLKRRHDHFASQAFPSQAPAMGQQRSAIDNQSALTCVALTKTIGLAEVRRWMFGDFKLRYERRSHMRAQFRLYPCIW